MNPKLWLRKKEMLRSQGTSLLGVAVSIQNVRSVGAQSTGRNSASPNRPQELAPTGAAL